MYFISFHHYKCKYTIQRLLEIYFVLNIFRDPLGNPYLSLRGSQCLIPFLYLLIYKENSLVLIISVLYSNHSKDSQETFFSMIMLNTVMLKSLGCHFQMLYYNILIMNNFE